MTGIEAIRKAALAMSHSPVRNYATPGLTSWLVGGEANGRVRLFASDRLTREWVTPHSHRFDLTCLVLAGSVTNILFTRGGGPSSNTYAQGTLRPVRGGLGKYEVVRGDGVGNYIETATDYEAGATYSMRASEIHSIRFSRDALVLFFEGPEVLDTSVVLEPHSDGKTIPTFTTAPWMFEREVLP